MTRDWRSGTCWMCSVALVLLAYALFGRPPYAFFALLRYAVAASAGLGAWALYAESKRYLPISLYLVLVGAIQLFGRMRRAEWAVFDWGAVAGLGVVLLVLVVNLQRTDADGKR
jgi:hypothetical protein